MGCLSGECQFIRVAAAGGSMPTISETDRVTIEDTSLAAFYKDMTVPERRTFWACSAGWALDGMDFMIYPLVIGTIIKLWNVDAGAAGLAATATLLASAIGGRPPGPLAPPPRAGPPPPPPH